MSLLLAALLSFQQTDEDLRAIVDRFNKATAAMDREGSPRSPWHEARRAGTPILKHLAAAFPGRSEGRRVDCGTCGWWAESEYPLVRLMLSFGDPALPVLISLLGDPDPSRARVAAAVLCRFPVKEVVGPLLAYAEKHDLAKDPDVERHVSEALGQSTFLTFKSRQDMAKWFETAKDRSQVDWLREAIDHPDRDRANRDIAVKGIQRLLAGPERLKALLRCFVDLGWREAGFALYWATGHSLKTGGKHLWDPAIMDKERAAWKAFRERPELDQQIEIALHCAGRHDASYPGSLMTSVQAGEFLLAHAERAFNHLERVAPDHPDCAVNFYASLPYVATSKSWERLEKFATTLKYEWIYIGQVLENSRHPSMADKMLEMVIAGAAEGMTCRGLMTELPKRVRPDMVLTILQAIPKASGRTQSTLLSALGATGDPRGWDLLQKEIFSDLPNSLQAAEILENFPGEKAVIELRKLLKSSNEQGVSMAARILGDRGDATVIPTLIGRLEATTTKIEDRWFMGALGVIRGKSPSMPADRTAFLSEFRAWWEKNKDRSRVDWLLDSLEEGIGIDVPYPNPLLFLAREALKDIPPELPSDERRREIVKRVRAWVAKTGFKFDANTIRVPYQSKR